MALVDSFVLTVCAVALACCILHPTLVFGSNHIQARSSSAASCTCETATTMLTCTAQPTGCDADEMPYGDSCYRFLRDDPKSRKAAHRDCIARNGHLVYIESEEEQNFLAFYGNFFYQDGGSNDRYWTGLIATNNYIWLDGSPFHRDLFTFDGDTRLGCIFVEEGASQIVLYVGNCGTVGRFICEFPSVIADVCQDEDRASSFGESCYIFFDSPRTQSEAQATCQTLTDGHLLYIETQDELTFIESLLGDTSQSELYWIGLTTQYVWLDGSNATYQAYDSESHNSGGQCFRMYPDSDFKWNDRSNCGAKYAYVCERELTVPEMQHVSGETCRTPVSSLNHLLESGALCVRGVGLPVYSGEYFLCPCGEKNCIKGCGCAMVSSGQSIMCNCRLCELTFSGKTGREPYTESAYEEWQVLNSTFLCECNDDATATGAEYYQFKDGAFSSLNSTCEDPSASNSGVIAGSVVAVVLVLLITVAIVIVVYRKGGKKLVSGRKKRVSKSGTAASADDTEGRQRYAGDLLPSGAHRNPAFAASLDPSPEPDEDYGYINPDTVQPSRQPDKQPASGETGSHSTPKQRPPIVARYQPKPTNAGQTGSDHGPNMPTSDQDYTSLTPPLGSPLNPQSSPLEGGFSGSDNDGGYQALTTGPHVDLPSSPDHDAYNHLEFTK